METETGGRQSEVCGIQTRAPCCVCSLRDGSLEEAVPELSPELNKTHPGKVEGRHSRQKELRGEAQGLESKGCVHEYKDLDITG